MKELLDKLSEPLGADDVELRIGQTSPKGFSLLLYKTARTDVRRLNECGVIWRNEHKYDALGLLTCVISVYDSEHNIWIDRVDVGTESQTEKQKGLYSDSFKRAGFRWGIGLELYNAPFIWVNWEMQEYNGKQKPKNFFNSNLSILEYEVTDGHFTKLTIKYEDKVVYRLNNHKTQSKSTAKEKDANKKEFMQILKNNGADDVLDFFNFLGVDHTDTKATANVVTKFLRSQEEFINQIETYMNWKRKNAS